VGKELGADNTEWEIDALMLALINVTVVNDQCTFLSSVYNGDDNAHHKRTFLAADEDST
jgi:hypothetical protein